MKFNETTRPVLHKLIKDMDNDPEGNELPAVGIAVINKQGFFEHVVWPI